MKAVVLDPSNGFNMDRPLVKSDVQKLVKVIIQQFSNVKLFICNSEYNICMSHYCLQPHDRKSYEPVVQANVRFIVSHKA